MITLYVTQIIAWVFSLSYFIVGAVYMDKYPNRDPYTQRDEYYMYRNGKWMIVLSIFFALYTPSFTLFVKEYKQVHIDDATKEDDEVASTNS
jgi:amino acid permease